MTQWRYIFPLEIFLEKSALVLNGLKTSSGAYGDEDLAIKYNSRHQERGKFENEERVVFKTDHSWENEIERFFNSISANSTISLGNSDDTLKLMQAMDRVYGR